MGPDVEQIYFNVVKSKSMRDIWRENTKHLFQEGAGCACTGACSDLGYCPVTGELKALTPSEVRHLIKVSIQESLLDGEVAEALKWWRKIVKEKRGI